MLGPYRIGRLLGRGGMGEVYEALDTVKERTVALKLLPLHYSDDADFRERFERESKTASKLSDPHVIPIHDWGEHDGVLYIDMRLVEGHDLRTLLKKGPLAPDRAIDILTQIAGALDAAHRNGLVHRDVKPDNILLNLDDFAYLVDFGIAHGASDKHLTMVGTALGTLAYMAPERLNDVPAGPASDIYALACVLYESVTGSVPFPSKTDAGIMTAHLTQPPPMTGGPLDPVLARGLAKDPAQRFGTAKEMMRAAAAAISHTPSTVTPPPRPYGPPPGGTPGSGPTAPPGFTGTPGGSRPTTGPSHPRTTSGPSYPSSRPGSTPTPAGPGMSGPTQVRSAYSGPTPGGPSGPTHAGPGAPSGPHTPPPGGGYTPPPGSGPQSLYGWGGSPQGPGPTPKTSNGSRVALIGVAVIVVLALVGAGVFFAVRAASGGGDDAAASSTTPSVATIACDYTDRTVVGGVSQPKPAGQQPKDGTVQATFTFAQFGDLAVTMNRSKAPCNVGAVTEVIQGGNFYSGNSCGELGTSYVFCGSSNGRVDNNPGWTSPDELPEGLTPGGKNTSGADTFTYPRGTVAVFPSSEISSDGGSTMLFFVSKDINLPLRYTIVGTVDASSLGVLDSIVNVGFIPSEAGNTYGKPKSTIIIQRAVITPG